MRQMALLVLVPAAVILGACGGNGGAGGAGGTGGSGSGATGGGGNACSSLTPIDNPDFCKAEASKPNCAVVGKNQKYDECGVAQLEPPGTLARSSKVKEYGGTGDPQVSCFQQGSYPDKPGMSQTVKMKGTAVIFSHGCQSNSLTIEVYKVKRTGGTDDGALGSLVGSAVTTDADCSKTGVASVEEMCSGMRYECVYEYDGVPTETELVVKTSGSSWTPLYDYNIFIRSSAVMNGEYKHDVRALASDDYGLISQTAIGAPITGGHGAIAGEVHDCGDVRLENAVVDVNVPRVALTYFGNDEAHPLPDLGAKGTSTLGLYSAIDVAPGQASIGAAGKTKDGKMVGLGFLRVQVFPDSVTTVTFRGMNPILVP